MPLAIRLSIRMHLTMKKRSVVSMLAPIMGVGYGLIIVALLHRHVSMDSGDIGAYINFFQEFGTWEYYNDFSIRGEGIFRYTIFFLKSFFDQEIVTVLSYIAFITSSITLIVYTRNIRSLRYFIVLAPLFLMVFLTPSVMNLYASGLRSGIAFTILLLGLVSKRDSWRYFLLVVASFFHLSMIPIAVLYILFRFLETTNNHSSHVVMYTILITCAGFISIAAGITGFNTTGVNFSFYYNFLLFYLGAVLVFSNKAAVTNIYGFLSIGLMFILLFGIFADLSFIRYAGNSVILYLFFLIKSGSVNTINIFSLFYTPYVILTLAYFLSN